MTIRLDPRAKLYLLVLANLTLFLHVNLTTEVILVTLYLSLYFLAGKTKSGVRMTYESFSPVHPCQTPP